MPSRNSTESSAITTRMRLPRSVRRVRGRTAPPSGGRRFGEKREQIADALTAGDRVGQRETRVDRVAVATPAAFAREVAGVDEVPDDAMRRPLRDAHAVADLAQADVRILRGAQQHARVARQERPAGRGDRSHDNRLTILERYVMLCRPSAR